MITNYSRIFIGNSIEAQRIINNLKAIDIIGILKNETESARLAGFVNAGQDSVEVYVHNDEIKRASAIL